MPTEGLTPRQLRVLLVEDNPDDGALLERHLRRSGFLLDLTRVETEAEMLAAMGAAETPDVVIADYNLPNFSGPAALQLVKRSALDIPFIMMSGAISEETAVESMRAGAQDYVTKQNLARLVPVLHRELREATARRERNAAETALRASQARFHRLADAMPLGLLISDSRGRTLYANAAVERLLRYPPGSLLQDGTTLQTLCGSLTETYLRQEQGTIVTEPFETVCTTADGQKIEVLLGAAQLNPEAADEERQIAAFIADLTMQKKSEEVLRRTEKLTVAGRLAASIAHEINNPLEAITNCLFLLSKESLPADARTYLALAQDELNRVSQITVQTLRFYRGSTHPSSTNLHELMETVLTLLDSRMRRQEITVAREFGEVPALVVHDGEIRQVLANLVGNAIDALGRGGRITLRSSRSRDWTTGAQGVRISVADDGTGMSAETLGRIFEPFFSTKGITGTGLGLWISREIVGKHGGRLMARSRERREGTPGGTVFSLFLPIGGEESVTGDAAGLEASVEVDSVKVS